ncbi:MAG: PqqD family protein [Elusimicrobiales bacterium]|nr:PqqD family protein [Elusimicrobiales bacterium]
MAGAKQNSGVSAAITWRKTGDEAVILNLETSEYYSLNETGTFIWELLAAGKPAARIAEALAAEYGVTEDQAAGDLADFLKDLSKHKILSRETAK